MVISKAIISAQSAIAKARARGAHWPVSGRKALMVDGSSKARRRLGREFAGSVISAPGAAAAGAMIGALGGNLLAGPGGVGPGALLGSLSAARSALKPVGRLARAMGYLKRRGKRKTGVYKAKKGMMRGGTSRMYRQALIAEALGRREKRDQAKRVANFMAERFGDFSQKSGFGRGKLRLRHGFYKAKPKTLYIYRPVENADAIITWAKAQGFKTTLPANDLHVTLAYSKAPMNWARLSDDYRGDEAIVDDDDRASYGHGGLTHAGGSLDWRDGAKRKRITGGVREVKALGGEGAVVLAFESNTLTGRWLDFKRAGAKWSYASFTPHITITYDGDGVDLAKVEPYRGEIILGEECWEEIKPNAQAEAIEREKAGVNKSLRTLGARVEALEKAKGVA